MITQSEIATEKIRDQIVRGDVAPGTHLQENPLSQQLGMSRTPIRTALSSLAQEGLLEYVAKRGYRVKEFTVNEIVDAYYVRATLEGMACRLVAEKGSIAGPAINCRNASRKERSLQPRLPKMISMGPLGGA